MDFIYYILIYGDVFSIIIFNEYFEFLDFCKEIDMFVVLLLEIFGVNKMCFKYLFL